MNNRIILFRRYVNYLTRFVLLLLFVSMIYACSNGSGKDNSVDDLLWYDRPAEIWEDALPLGNGRLGVMVFGNPSGERIQLNDDSLWPADKEWDEPAGNAQDLEKIRELILLGRNSEADQLMVEKFSRKDIIRSHQTLGELFIDFNHSNITDYRRELNISKAISKVSYKANGNQVTQEVFVSKPHQIVVIKISTLSDGGLNGKIRLVRPDDNNHPTASTITKGNSLLVMSGEVTQHGAIFDSKPAPVREGVRFETCLKIDHEGGEVLDGEDYLELNNVKSATLFLISNSSFYHDDYREENKNQLKALEQLRLNTIRNDHINDYRKLYSRVKISLPDYGLDTISTDQRINRIKNGKDDPGMTALLFQYGRYLLICSSRDGTNPANLQGLWNQHIEAPWNADYHLNINLQMNYWLADVTNLSELNNPLFNYIDNLVANGKSTASKNFNCGGAFIPHASDIWAPTWIRARNAYWGSSFGAGGWLMQHYWHHFEFNRDTIFLKERVFPAMHEVARFYSDWIIEDPRDGKLVSIPSSSPENRFIGPEGVPVALCAGSAVDQQIIAEVFDNYIKTCGILNVTNDLLKTITGQRQQLRDGFVLGSDGRILEWDREYPEPEPGHRHMSHLYGFHPGTSISRTDNPKLFEAVRRTLDYRLAHGGAGTGWSRAWLINCAARLLNGEMAHEHIQFFFKNSVYDNLFCAHPPYQIDGNFGFTAGIAEMLLQSHEDSIIRVLPALPDAWRTGSVKGLKARGGLIVDIYWEDGVLEKVVFEAGHDMRFDLFYNNKIIPVDIKRGETITHQGI